MGVLFRAWPRDGHFPGCPRRTLLGAQYSVRVKGCSRCKLIFYVLALVLTMLTAGAEFVGSNWTRSESLFADAWHMVSDGLGYGLGIVAALLVARERMQRVLEGAAAAFVMMAGMYMLFRSTSQLMQGEPSPLTGTGALLAIALLGLAVNLLLVALMRALRVEHVHGHTHAHEDGVLEANLSHTIADAASSGGVLVNALLSRYFGSVAWVGYLDLLLSLAIAGWLTYQGWHILDRVVLGHSHHD